MKGRCDPADLHVVVPGSIEQRTGGYIYDSRMVQGLRGLGWTVTVHELAGTFPDTDAQAHVSFTETLGAIPDGARVVVDGLAMGGLPGPVLTNSDRLRIVSLVHHPLADETGLDSTQRERFLALEREALTGCVGVVVTSAFTASRLGELGTPPSRVRAVPPGVDPAPLAAGPAAGEPPRLLCVASVTPRKGQAVLVEALWRLRDRAWSCVCAGSLERDRAYADSVRSRVEELGLLERILFPGECDGETLNHLYDVASVFVLPSYFEGYGMVLAEAFARGIPVVATTAGAIPSTVPPDTGILVSPGDPEALAEAVGSLIRFPVRLARLALAARQHAGNLSTWEEASSAFAAAIDELVPRHAS